MGNEPFCAVSEDRGEGERNPEDREAVSPLHQPLDAYDAQGLRPGSRVADRERHDQDQQRHVHYRRSRVVDNAAAKDEAVADSVNRGVQEGAADGRHLLRARELPVDHVEGRAGDEQCRGEREVTSPDRQRGQRGGAERGQRDLVGLKPGSTHEAKHWAEQPVVVADEHWPEQPTTGPALFPDWQLTRPHRKQADMKQERESEEGDEPHDKSYVARRSGPWPMRIHVYLPINGYCDRKQSLDALVPEPARAVPR